MLPALEPGGAGRYRSGMELDWEYAVVGAGPAGASAARELALRGRRVALFDWAPRAEKPCGGGVPARGMARCGALLDGVPRREARTIRVVGPRGDEAEVELASPVAIFARRELDEALRLQAERAGARRIGARVVGLAPARDGFELSMRRSAQGPIERGRARYVVAADGAAGTARRRLLELAGFEAPGPDHFSRTFTIYPELAAVPVRSGTMELAWVGGADGYGWTFPRVGHASIGWCLQGAFRGGDGLRETLAALMRSGALSGPAEGAGRGGEPGVGALIPSFRGDAAARSPVEGARFALIGDAAGAVDPITREGIHYALATGAAVGECDPLARPGRYAAWFDAELRPELVRAAALAPRFFALRFVTTMVRGLARSSALRDVFGDLVAGCQGYATLRRRLLRALPRALPALSLAMLLRGRSRGSAAER